MPRIDATDETERYRYICPECESHYWRAVNGLFECRACDSDLPGLMDQKTDEVIPRSQFEFIGPHTSWKAPYATRK